MSPQDPDLSQKDLSDPKELTAQEKIDIAAEKHTKIFLKALEANARLEICRECDKYIMRARICAECKCFMPMKVRLRVSKCPLEKW